MEIKRNEATINRPEGDRVIDAPYVFIDIPQFIRQLKEETAWEKNDRNGITVFKSSALTITLTALKPGAEIRDNKTDEYLTIQLLKGHVRIATESGDIDVEEKQEMAFHPNIIHSLKAISDSIILIRTYKTE